MFAGGRLGLGLAPRVGLVGPQRHPRAAPRAAGASAGAGAGSAQAGGAVIFFFFFVPGVKRWKEGRLRLGLGSACFVGFAFTSGQVLVLTRGWFSEPGDLAAWTPVALVICHLLLFFGQPL